MYYKFNVTQELINLLQMVKCPQ